MEWGVHVRGHALQGATHGRMDVWQGTCVAWEVCVAGGGMHCRGKERLPLQQTVCILLECILVYINFHSK